MQQHGIRADQVTQVRGFADQRLRKKDDPLDAGNRRISLIVQYQSRPETLESDSSKVVEDSAEKGHAKNAGEPAGAESAAPPAESKAHP